MGWMGRGKGFSRWAEVKLPDVALQTVLDILKMDSACIASSASSFTAAAAAAATVDAGSSSSSFEDKGVVSFSVSGDNVVSSSSDLDDCSINHSEGQMAFGFFMS